MIFVNIGVIIHFRINLSWIFFNLKKYRFLSKFQFQSCLCFSFSVFQSVFHLAQAVVGSIGVPQAKKLRVERWASAARRFIMFAPNFPSENKFPHPVPFSVAGWEFGCSTRQSQEYESYHQPVQNQILKRTRYISSASNRTATRYGSTPVNKWRNIF